MSIMTCKTLKVMNLWSSFIVLPPASGCFPSLKALYVLIDRPLDNSIANLFSCCPVLEDLSINGSHGLYGDEPVMSFTISAPQLKRLNIHWMTHNDYKKCSFYVAAPKLEIFHLWQYPYTNCYLENAKSSVRVTIDLQDHFADSDKRVVFRGTALLAGINNVRYLSFSAHCLKGCCFPVFDKLSRLELALYNCYYWELLKDLLIKSPKLEYLVVELMDYDCPDTVVSDHQWTPPGSTPDCLTTHLKTVSIKGFKGKPDEVDVAMYMLKNCEVLEKLMFYIEGVLRKEELFKELAMCHWASKACQVEIYTEKKDTRLSFLGVRSWV